MSEEVMRQLPAERPCYRGYSDQAPADWRRPFEEHLRSAIGGHAWSSNSVPRICFYTRHRAQVVQVFHSSWIVHVQCALNGDEMNVAKYGLSSERILVSLDVEKGPLNRLDAQSKAIDFRPLQHAALDRIRSIEDESLVSVRLDPQGHHVVWRTMPFAEDSGTLRAIAEEMTTYVRLLLRPAWEGAHGWGVGHGIQVEALP